MCRPLLAPRADLLPHPPNCPPWFQTTPAECLLDTGKAVAAAPKAVSAPGSAYDVARLPMASDAPAGLLLTPPNSSPLHQITARYRAHAIAPSGYRDKLADGTPFSTPPEVFRHSPALTTSLAHPEDPITPDETFPIPEPASDSRHSTPIPLLTPSPAV